MRAAERRLCELQEPAGSVVVRLESAAPAAQVAGRPASVTVYDLPSRSQGGDAACPLSPTHYLDFVLSKHGPQKVRLATESTFRCSNSSNSTRNEL